MYRQDGSLSELNNALASVVKRVRRSLVMVNGSGRSAGSGTIWHEDGLILTNAHVLRGRRAQVTLWDGRVVEGKLLRRDQSLDLAAIGVNASDLQPLPLANSRDLQPGHWVMAVGYPWGVPGAVSAGAVIGLGRPTELGAGAPELIQVSLQLRPGHSGGPLVNGNGQLLGLSTMMQGPQVGLAIPVHVIVGFLKKQLRPRMATAD